MIWVPPLIIFVIISILAVIVCMVLDNEDDIDLLG